MGQSAQSKIRKIGFDDVKHSSKDRSILLIATKSLDNGCRIVNTIDASVEEQRVNDCLGKRDKPCVVVYGKNCTDEQVEAKAAQLVGLGFPNVYVYLGGMLEWLLLQDIYGADEFPTTSAERDMLRFKAAPILALKRIEYID